MIALVQNSEAYKLAQTVSRKQESIVPAPAQMISVKQIMINGQSVGNQRDFLRPRQSRKAVNCFGHLMYNISDILQESTEKYIIDLE